eukprot:5664013-Pleurochrysis_carterae.AAC.1
MIPSSQLQRVLNLVVLAKKRPFARTILSTEPSQPICFVTALRWSQQYSALSESLMAKASRLVAKASEISVETVRLELRANDEQLNVCVPTLGVGDEAQLREAARVQLRMATTATEQ